MKKIILSISVLITMAIYTNIFNTNQFINDTETSIFADYPQYIDANNLVNNSDLIFTGVVKSITNEILEISSNQGEDNLTGLVEAEPLPYCLYEIEVLELYQDITNKYGTEDTTIFLKSLGGVIENHNYVVHDSIPIIKGETYLFVAQTFDNSYPSLVNVNQSVYNLNSPIATISEYDDYITLDEILEILH